MCDVEDSQQCGPGEQLCSEGRCAIPCNGFLECEDGSDETTRLCSQRQCSTEDSLGGFFVDVAATATQKFRCNYGGCIARSLLCNGNPHCWDGSDETEKDCTAKRCKTIEFKCDYGGCIRRIWRCNGRADCRDGSDETAEICGKKPCSSSEFRCNYGACIDKAKLCDNVSDCYDHSDESEEKCGEGHKFSERLTIRVPDAETKPDPISPTNPPVVTPPPVTPPPTLPPTPPPPTPPSDPCRSASLCTCPTSSVCVPCDRLDFCNTLLDGPKCSLPSEDEDHGITVNVLACGSQALVNVAAFSRNLETLCSTREVPTETVVIADCWGTATILAKCHEDGKWHPYGSQGPNTMEPSSRLCQPKSINSQICGRRPRYRRPIIPFVSSSPQQQWPWLAAVLRNLTYACTATVISQDYLLTAAHCLTRSKESTLLVDIMWIIVKYLGTNGNLMSSLVKKIHIHPDYRGGNRPSKDIALIQLPSALIFSHKLVPACISTENFPDRLVAATFDRPDGSFNTWETILHKHDARCSVSLNRCSAPEIKPDQFCAVDINGRVFLHEGASGGPYLVNMGNDVMERWTVSGVVSAAASNQFTCKQPHTIFAKISEFWPWIRDCVHLQKCS
ncbi:modular serine protease-like isoform X2 [Palaemon carinicauda]|uniref:modular serine protease-like isoform X2 n=1 Tax=Palaemon carinicauda TaxID=392227 RepID=UPI0035B62F17